MLQLKAPLVARTKLSSASKRGVCWAIRRRCAIRGDGLTRRESVLRRVTHSDLSKAGSGRATEPFGGEEASLHGREREGGRDPLPETGISGEQERSKRKRKPRAVSDDTKKKISESMKGRRLSDEHRRKISEGKKGRRFSDEHRKKLSLAKLGRKRDPELMKKIGEKKKGYRHSFQARIKMSKAKRGTTASAATKAKMSASQKARCEERRRETQLKDIIQESRISKPKLNVNPEEAMVDLSSLRRELAAWLQMWYRENAEKPSLKDIEHSNPFIYDKFIRYLNLIDAMREEDSE